MESNRAIDALGALSQETRLAIFRRLIRIAPDSIPAGELARELEAPPSTLSSHLAILHRAGLVHAERRSREIRYSADTDGMRRLVEFLILDCCKGRPEKCGRLLDAALPLCCPQT